MKILILSPYPERIAHIFVASGDEVTATAERLVEPPRVDFIVSYGYRFIVKEPVISRFMRRIINVHISMLPWNRGADPNFWSWFDRTPKGVTIHEIDSGIDTGPILVQDEVHFGRYETLRTSYDKLQEAAVDLIASSWGAIRRGMAAEDQGGPGSYHRVQDLKTIWHRFALGFDTPVAEIERIGEREGANFRA